MSTIFSIIIGSQIVVLPRVLSNLQSIRNSSQFINLNKARKMSVNTTTTPSVERNDTGNDKTIVNQKAPGLLKILENNPKRLKRIRFLANLFHNNGHELRIAGGAVRDILGGVEPKDIDFATTARPEQSLEIVSKHEDLLRIIVTVAGQRHGTVAVKFKEVEIVDIKKMRLDSMLAAAAADGSSSTAEQAATRTKTHQQQDKPEYDEESPFEITTLRCDKFTDGRHAEVEFVNDWRIDAERRDLTINAMFLTIDEGKLIDYFEGKQDLEEGRVKFVGSAELRIREDYLRILRFFRFWSRYGKNQEPDKETLTTIENNLKGLEIISGERLWQEMKKILSHHPCYGVLRMMLKLKVLKHLGVVDNNDDTSKEDNNSDDDYVKEVLEELKQVERNVENYSKDALGPDIEGDLKQLKHSSDRKLKELLPAILFATTLRSQDMCLNAHKRMKFSNMERDTLIYILENKNKDISMKSLKFQLATIHAPERASALIRIRGLLIYKGIYRDNQIEKWQVPEFPLTGNIVAQEIRKRKLQGTKIKDVLDSLKFHWAESDYKSTKNDLEKLLQEKCDEHLKLASDASNEK